MQLAKGEEKYDISSIIKDRGNQLKIGNKDFDFKRHIYIMGILNVTPDSFSDGGKYYIPDKALFKVQQMVEEGADIIDIGGESTRPGYIEVSVEEEIERVVPVIEKIKENFDVPISLDTYKAVVAKEGLKAGAHMINDIWGLKKEKTMAEVIADYKVPCCLMHNRQTTDYTNFLEEVIKDLNDSLLIANRSGIAADNIILDPGIGFGKNYEQNMQMMAAIEKIVRMGYPVLLGVSRKSMIGNTLHLPVEERLSGTLATNIYGAVKGCSLLRVHDVKETVRALKMVDRLVRH